jgi:hypothetical protein
VLRFWLILQVTIGREEKRRKQGKSAHFWHCQRRRVPELFRQFRRASLQFLEF